MRGSFPSNLALSGGTFASPHLATGANQLWKLDAKGKPTKVASFTHAATVDGLGEAVIGSALVSNAHGTAMFFAADDGVHGPQLWRTDGTMAGTYVVKNFGNLGRSFGMRGYSGFGEFRFTTVRGLVYFVTTAATGESFWVTDGTTTGTKQVLIPQPPGSITWGVTQLTPFNDGSCLSYDGRTRGRSAAPTFGS